MFCMSSYLNRCPYKYPYRGVRTFSDRPRVHTASPLSANIMKLLAFFAVFLLLVDLSVQVPKLVNCPSDFVLTDSMSNSCGVFTCDGPARITGKGCGTYQCAEGKQLAYKESDNSKPYPDCCGGPICAE